MGVVIKILYFQIFFILFFQKHILAATSNWTLDLLLSLDACELTLDPNTAHRGLILSEDNRQATFEKEEQPYRYHPERFDCFKQVLCTSGLTGRCYWEMETQGKFYYGVTYQGISRRGSGLECALGGNDKSWSLSYNDTRTMLQYLRHNDKRRRISPEENDTNKVAVYLDWPAGTLSFYRLFPDARTHICSIYYRFKEPLYPGFGFEYRFDEPPIPWTGSSISLC